MMEFLDDLPPLIGAMVFAVIVVGASILTITLFAILALGIGSLIENML